MPESEATRVSIKHDQWAEDDTETTAGSYNSFGPEILSFGDIADLLAQA
jgi:hypothetical protein